MPRAPGKSSWSAIIPPALRGDAPCTGERTWQRAMPSPAKQDARRTGKGSVAPGAEPRLREPFLDRALMAATGRQDRKPRPTGPGRIRYRERRRSPSGGENLFPPASGAEDGQELSRKSAVPEAAGSPVGYAGSPAGRPKKIIVRILRACPRLPPAPAGKPLHFPAGQGKGGHRQGGFLPEPIRLSTLDLRKRTLYTSFHFSVTHEVPRAYSLP